MHPPRHVCRPKPGSIVLDHPPANVMNEGEMCLKSSHTDRGHCTCWREHISHCCDCRAPQAPTEGMRVEAIGIPERIQGEVVTVTAGGYFSVRYDEGSFYKAYRPTETGKFRFSPAVAHTGGDIPGQSTEAYSSCPAGNNGP